MEVNHYGYTDTRAGVGVDVSISLIFKGTWKYLDGECYIRVDNRGNVYGYLNQ